LAACFTSSPASRQRAFTPGHQARYPASYAAPPAGEPGKTARGSCCLSAAGIRFLGILSRPGIPPLLRSAYRTATISGADPSGFSMFRTRETRPGPGALCTPGTAVPARTRMHPVSAACRLAATGPCHPGTAARPGMFFSRGISKGSLAFAPPGLPLACDPRTDRGSSGFTPGFTPGWAGPSRACRGGDGPQALARGNVAAINSGLLPRRTHSLRATSRRNAWRRALQSRGLQRVVTA
jgi:hypothetical protein